MTGRASVPPGPRPRVRHNDYPEPPAHDSWTPRLTVSVVIPAYQCQDSLDRALAALAAQSYPAELLEVVIADDGSSPAITPPPIRPDRTRIVRVPDGEWGRGWARQTGAVAARGDVIHWLDADMIPHHEHIAAHMRWHHMADYFVVHGAITFTSAERNPPSPDEVFAAVRDGAESELFPAESAHPHEYIDKTLADTRRLRDSGFKAYLLHTGATTSVSAALLRAVGGVDTSLNMGEDTDLGYRLAQAGAVFVPEGEARSWHVGLSTVQQRQSEVHRHNWSFIGEHIPDLRFLRKHPRRQYAVPYVHHVIDAHGATYEQTRASVDAALAGTIADAAVSIIGPWNDLTAGRRSSLDEPLLDHRLIANAYTAEPRVTLAVEVPATSTPVPFRLTSPAGWAVGGDTVARLVKLADDDGLGLICAALAEEPGGVVTMRLERTAAFGRAALFPDEKADDVVDELYGSVWVDGADYGVHPWDQAQPLTGVPADLRAQAAKWRAEAHKAREEAERWKNEAERLAAEQAAATGARRRWRTAKAAR